MNSKEVSSISAQIPTSSGTRLNEFKRSVIHLGANPDQQQKKAERIQKKCHPSRRKPRPAAEQDWTNSKELSSISAQIPTSSGTRLNEFKRSVDAHGYNSSPQGATSHHYVVKPRTWKNSRHTSGKNSFDFHREPKTRRRMKGKAQTEKPTRQNNALETQSRTKNSL